MTDHVMNFIQDFSARLVTSNFDRAEAEQIAGKIVELQRHGCDALAALICLTEE